MSSEIKVLTDPKVFISYSWTTPEHEEWVVDLATRLMQNDGIMVVLDKWDLKEGHDTTAFMESMVTSSDIHKVLIICDRGYQVKADGRKGGVGTETQIITPQIYKDVKQEKFIPIVSERDELGNTFIPTYMSSRLYIDLSSEKTFEENYEKLVRNIYQVPLYKKPTLGKPPQHLFEENSPRFPVGIVLQKVKALAERYPNRVKHLWGEFSDAFMESLAELKIENITDGNMIHEEVVKRIEQSTSLRNYYINMLEVMCITETFDVENVVEFFEKLHKFTMFQGSGSYFDTQFDQYKFIITELFLYTATILLKNKMYPSLAQLLNSEYYIESKSRYDKPVDYSRMRHYLKSLDYRNQVNKLNRVSLHADFIIQRVSDKYRNELLDADLILYYISKLNRDDADQYRIWFPLTYIYHKEEGIIKLLSKMKSKKHFDNVKVLFNVSNPNELKPRIEKFTKDSGFRNTFGDGLPHILGFINSEEICSIP